LTGKTDVMVKSLSYGERRQLELVLALVNSPRLLLLDEPCAGLSPAERQRLSAIIRDLPRTITMLMIEHDMDVALALADRVTVLNRGAMMLEGSAQEVRMNPQVREVYFGQV
jgi:branched-chain amino acid transport system ATP-binding protein